MARIDIYKNPSKMVSQEYLRYNIPAHWILEFYGSLGFCVTKPYMVVLCP